MKSLNEAVGKWEQMNILDFSKLIDYLPNIGTSAKYIPDVRCIDGGFVFGGYGFATIASYERWLQDRHEAKELEWARGNYVKLKNIKAFYITSSDNKYAVKTRKWKVEYDAIPEE